MDKKCYSRKFCTSLGTLVDKGNNKNFYLYVSSNNKVLDLVQVKPGRFRLYINNIG